MSDNQAAFVAQLYQLQMDFLASCCPRGRVIESAHAVALEVTDPKLLRASLQVIHDEAHKLAGASGCFGFSQLSVAAYELEQGCHTLLVKETVPAAEDSERVQTLLRRIQDAVTPPLD
ncbi:MAG: Hpt domain-containing protein [Motiliproteus sp.]